VFSALANGELDFFHCKAADSATQSLTTLQLAWKFILDQEERKIWVHG